MRPLRSSGGHCLKNIPTGACRKGELRRRRWVCLLCNESHPSKCMFPRRCRGQKEKTHGD